MKNIELMDEVKLAKILNISVKTLQSQRWQKVGIPYLKIGRTVRYRRVDVEAFLEQSVVKTVQN